MQMHEFGTENKKKILLIHGAGTSYKMWTVQIKYLSAFYHLYVPTLNGHIIGGNKDYLSPQDEAAELLKWFTDNHIEKIDLICGASLGANVAAELLINSPHFADYALIESLKSYHYGPLTTKLFCLLGKRILLKAASVKGLMDGSYEKSYISDDMKHILSHMTDRSLYHILLTASRYQMPKGHAKISAKTLIVYGSKEEKLCRANTHLLQTQIKDCKCIVLPDYDHGELSIGHPEKHIEMISHLLDNNK